MAQLQRVAIAPNQIQETEIALTPEQYHYLSRVLRLRQGDRFIAMNGVGQSWIAALTQDRAKILESLQESQRSTGSELPIKIALLAALPKGNGFDEVVRCCTELGVSSIIPAISDRTLLKPSPQKLERWRRIALEAAEQSERQIVPTILEPVAFTTGLSLSSKDIVETRRYICVARGDYPHLLDDWQNRGYGRTEPEAIAIAIGPEGGWTDREIEEAIASGFQPVSLGSRILRAVLAPIVALSLVAAALEAYD